MKKALIIGASKGIGLGLVKGLVGHGWQVTGSVRQSSGTALHEFAKNCEQVKIVQIDITHRAEISALKAELAGESFDLLLVNAGISLGNKDISETTADEFSRLMLTNALAPLWVVKSLDSLVKETGTVAATSSRVGSISLNDTGGFAAYRASKSALNQLLKTYSAENPEKNVLAVSPGAVMGTDLTGSSDYPGGITLDESISGLVKMLEKHLGESSIQFRNWQDELVAW